MKKRIFDQIIESNEEYTIVSHAQNQVIVKTGHDPIGAAINPWYTQVSSLDEVPADCASTKFVVAAFGNVVKSEDKNVDEVFPARYQYEEKYDKIETQVSASVLRYNLSGAVAGDPDCFEHLLSVIPSLCGYVVSEHMGYYLNGYIPYERLDYFDAVDAGMERLRKNIHKYQLDHLTYDDQHLVAAFVKWSRINIAEGVKAYLYSSVPGLTHHYAERLYLIQKSGLDLWASSPVRLCELLKKHANIKRPEHTLFKLRRLFATETEGYPYVRHVLEMHGYSWAQCRPSISAMVSFLTGQAQKWVYGCGVSLKDLPKLLTAYFSTDGNPYKLPQGKRCIFEALILSFVTR